MTNDRLQIQLLSFHIAKPLPTTARTQLLILSASQLLFFTTHQSTIHHSPIFYSCAEAGNMTGPTYEIISP
jgi:hypothetical protein